MTFLRLTIHSDLVSELVTSAIGWLRSTDVSGSSRVSARVVQTTGLDLARLFGTKSPIARNFSAVRYSRSGPTLATIHTYERQLPRIRLEG